MTILSTVRLFSTTALCMFLLVGCGNKDGADAASDVAELNPMAIYAGDWMTEAYIGDGAEPALVVLLKGTPNQQNWTMKFTHIDEPVMANSVVLMGDSLVSTWGPFKSGIREGLVVENLKAVMIVDGDMLSGRAEALYSDGSVANNIRLEAERLKN